MPVSLKVAKFLKTRFSFNKSTLYVYDGEIQKFSLEKCSNPIPAPTVMEAVEFLWGEGLQIYQVPEGLGSRGYLKVGDKNLRMDKLGNTPLESYETCLEFLCGASH